MEGEKERGGEGGVVTRQVKLLMVINPLLRTHTHNKDPLVRITLSPNITSPPHPLE